MESEKVASFFSFLEISLASDQLKTKTESEIDLVVHMIYFKTEITSKMGTNLMFQNSDFSWFAKMMVVSTRNYNVI